MLLCCLFCTGFLVFAVGDLVCWFVLVVWEFGVGCWFIVGLLFGFPVAVVVCAWCCFA